MWRSKGGKGYPAASVWDACTGWGSPNDAKLLAGLKNLASSSNANVKVVK